MGAELERRRTGWGAARLFGAVEAQIEAAGLAMTPADRADYERFRALTRSRLGEAAFDALLAEGRWWTQEQAAACALETVLVISGPVEEFVSHS